MTAQLFCTQCGAAGSVGQKFCATCGESLGAATQDPRLGTMLGAFRIESVIAAGGFGVVYRAYDTKLQRYVALKLLREELAVDAEFRHRFLRESRAAAGVDHQNILPMFDAGEVDGVLYIATRLVDGVDLRKRLAREGVFEVDRALRIVHQIGVALDFAHGKGLVHRDVKPANILLVAGDYGEDEHAYLIDFGITKNVESDRTLTMTGHFVGTPEYVAPEQIANDRTDGRADQYALACVLYHCLTGGPPFVRDSTVDMLFAHIHAEPPRASAVCTGLPGSVDNAIARALSKHPARRFETCRAFVAAARAGTGVPTPVRPTAPAQQPQTEPAAAPPQPAQPARTPPRRLRSTPAQPSPAAPTPPAPPAPPAPPPPSSPTPQQQPSRPRHPRGPRIAAFVVVLVALVAAGALAGVLLGGSGDPDEEGVASNTTMTFKRGDTVVTVTVPVNTAPAASTPDAARASGDRQFPPLGVDELKLARRDLAGYAVALPAGWQVRKDDEVESESPSRRRTEVANGDGDVTLLVDHLVDYQYAPRRNRDLLDSAYARVRPQYKRLKFDDYMLNGRTSFEWRYRYEVEKGKPLRRVVDIIFRDGRHDFAVLAYGDASYDDLTALTRAAAETIVVSGRPSNPEPGVYSGIGYQRGERSGTTDDYTVAMTFSADGARVEYPDLACSARLAPNGVDGARRIYSERDVSGSCDEGGVWRVRVLSDTKIAVRWTNSATDYTVSGELQR